MWNAAQAVLPLLATAAISILIGRLLGAEALGYQSLVAYSLAILRGPTVIALYWASMQALAASRGAGSAASLRALAGWSIRAQWANGLLIALVLTATGSLSDSVYRWCWFLAALIGLVDAVGYGYSARVNVAHGNWISVSRRRLVQEFATQSAGIVLLLAGLGIEALFLAALMGSVWFTYGVWRSDPTRAARSRHFPGTLRRLWVTFATRELLMQVVAQRIELIFLAAWSGTEQVAMYSVAFMAVTSVVMIPRSLLGVGMQSVAERLGTGDESGLESHLRAATRVTVAASIPLATVLAALGPAAVQVLYGSDFQQAGDLARLMAPLVLVLPVAALFETFWSGADRMDLVLKTAAVGGVIDLIACVVLIPRFDAYGAAFANIVGQGAAAILLVLVTVRRFPRIGIAWRRVIAAGAVCGVGGLSASLVASRIGGWSGLLLGSAVIVVVMALFGLFVGYVDSKDGQWLRASVPGSLARALPLFAGRNR